MSSAEKYTPNYTVEDYQRWEGDWELWDGIAVSMSPSPFAKHGKALVNLASKLGNEINANESCREKVEVVAEVDWNISNSTVVRPDISVLCGPLPEKHIVSPPAIVVEILSQSTRDRDLSYKRTLYQTQGVPYYLIIDPDAKTYTQLKLKDGSYQEISSGPTATFTICETCTIEIPIAEALA